MQPTVRQYYNLEELGKPRQLSVARQRSRPQRNEAERIRCWPSTTQLLTRAAPNTSSGCRVSCRSVTEIKPEPRSSKTREQLLTAEKGRIREVLASGQRLVVLLMKKAMT